VLLYRWLSAVEASVNEIFMITALA